MFKASQISADRVPVGLWAQFRRQSPGYLLGFLFLGVYQTLQYWFDTTLDRAVDLAVSGDASSTRRTGAILIGIALVAFLDEGDGEGGLLHAATSPWGSCMVMQCRLPFCSISGRHGTTSTARPDACSSAVAAAASAASP